MKQKKMLCFLATALLLSLPGCGYADDALPGKIAFRAHRFPYEKNVTYSNVGTTVYEKGEFNNLFHKFYNPRWSFDGTKLMGGQSGRPPKTFTLYQYPPSQGQEDVPIAHHSTLRAWFSDSKRIAYVGHQGRQDNKYIDSGNIYVYDLEKEEVIQQVTHYPDEETDLEIGDLDVSSDGELIAYSRDVAGQRSDRIYIANLESGEIQELFKGSGLRFIRGTHQFIYATTVPDDRVDIKSKVTFAVVWHDLDTGESRRITNDARYVGIKDPTPSPDGKWVCYVHHALTDYDGITLRVIRMDGTDERILARGENYASPDWAP